MSFDEQPIIDRWWKINKGDYVIDCGCATGEYTLSALQQGAGFVYAFDGDMKAVDACKERVSNIGADDRCKVYFAGVWDTILPKYSLIEAWEEMGIPRSFTEPIVGYQPVEFGTIDAMDLNRIDWIKLDIEGMEYRALLGAKQTLARFHPKLLIENHTEVDHIGPWMKQQAIWPKLTNLLTTFDYKTEEVPHMGRSHLFAT